MNFEARKLVFEFLHPEPVLICLLGIKAAPQIIPIKRNPAAKLAGMIFHRSVYDGIRTANLTKINLGAHLPLDVRTLLHAVS